MPGLTGDKVSLEEARRQLDKDVHAAIARQMKLQPDVWRITVGGHKFLLLCCDKCCRITVAGTPSSPVMEARRIGRLMARHPLLDEDPRSRRRTDSTT